MSTDPCSFAAQSKPLWLVIIILIIILPSSMWFWSHNQSFLLVHDWDYYPELYSSWNASVHLTLHQSSLAQWNTVRNWKRDHYLWNEYRGNRTWEPFEPVASCWDEVRVGQIGDGGKWVCGLSQLKSPCLIYSLGSNGDPSFELAINTATSGECEIYTFDPYDYSSIWKDFPSNMHYYSYGFGERNEDVQWQKEITYADKRNYTAKLRTLHNITSMLGHTHIHLLKADIEGGEYSVVPALFKGVSSELIVEQMLWEFHAGSALEVLPLFTYISDHHYVMFHKEHNHLCPLCCEYAWMINSFVNNTLI